MAISPFKEALQKLAGRGIVPADLSTSQWSDVPLALRERAFFSARTINASYLQDVRDRIEKILNPQTVMRDGWPVTEGMDLATARTELKGILTLGHKLSGFLAFSPLVLTLPALFSPLLPQSNR